MDKSSSIEISLSFSCHPVPDRRYYSTAVAARARTRVRVEEERSDGDGNTVFEDFENRSIEEF
jgi:hypothetical protein